MAPLEPSLDSVAASLPATMPTVLVVDDASENLRILGELLKPHYLVRVANSGERALGVVLKKPVPSLILLDVMMPGMDGYEVIRRLRADPATRDIPVIFVTAKEGTEDEEQGLALGAMDYIAKPIRPAIVLSRVKTQIELKRNRDFLKDKNEWLEHEIALRMQENTLINKMTIRALAGIAEVRDESTGQHILRTEAYVRVLAAQLSSHGAWAGDLTPDRIDRIASASVLHDIGKVGIPDEILLKPGRLSPDEFEIMKTHSVIGADAIAAAIEATRAAGFELFGASGDTLARAFTLSLAAMEIARSHHEKWDGSGYPEGLAGEAIPAAGRIMALADVFDALTTTRVYKPAMTFEEATAIIVKGRGSHFDPDVVDAFLARRETFMRIMSSGAPGASGA